MSETGLDPQLVERLRALVGERLGLALEEARLPELHQAAEERLRARGASGLEGYLDLLADPVTGPEELRALADRVTVGETYFFRHTAQLAAFTEEILPALAPAAAGRGALRLLSAGCSTGEEPYTLAILLREHLPRLAPGCVGSVLGVDVSPAALTRARRGCYSSWSLRQVDPALREREWRREGREWCVGEGPRRLVAFEERNLIAEDPQLWRPGWYDAVFFRNVGMYMPAARFREVVERCARSLVPGGFLVLGDAETLRSVSTRFELCHTHGAFYYRLREGAPPPPQPPFRARSPQAEPAPLLDDASWVGTIQAAAERIERLAAGTGSRQATQPPWDLRAVTELLREDRLDAAQEALDALPGAADHDPEALLLRAAVLTNRGQIAAAEAACRQLLAQDGLSAGAHYLLALCREHRGDPAGAAELDRTAAHLDPTFAMPHLHLALLARRQGDQAEERRCLALARDLLSREDGARILLFGGGFTREALLSLCDAGGGAR